MALKEGKILIEQPIVESKDLIAKPSEIKIKNQELTNKTSENNLKHGCCPANQRIRILGERYGDQDISDIVYQICIVNPNSESMDIKIGGSDMVQELYHLLLERDQTCHRTCFKIYYEDKPLDHFVEIRNIPNIKTRSTFYVVEELYNVREARIHVRHLRDILRCLDISDSVNGVDFSSFSCLSAITHTEEIKKNKVAEIKNDIDCLPSDYLLPGNKELCLQPLLTLLPEQKIQALKDIAFSAFNPPPGPQKMKGDVLYLQVDTVEGKRFYITCCSRGFFVNSTVGDNFNPNPSTSYGRGTIYHSLFDLLSELSSHFRKSLAQILKLRSERHVYERLPTPFQIYSWIVPSIEHTQDHIRAEELTQPHRIGLEDHVPGQTRDWNEELQTTHDLPRVSFAERFCRDRAKFKVYSDFLAAATRGAENIVDGSILAINSVDDPKTHMFIWNNIFFSLGFDVKEYYKELGGDAAAYAAASADLSAVRAYYAIDHPKLHTLGMAIIDYKGLRLTAQSIIPGILERDQEESVVYGSYDSGKTVVSLPAYEEYLEKTAKRLHIAPHKVLSDKNDNKVITLFTSYESKGIIGNDGRHYLLDLLRTFPPDVNFLKENEDETTKDFPRFFKHKLVSLRQELIDAFVEYRYAYIIKLVTTLIQQNCLNKQKNVITDEIDNKKKDYTVSDKLLKEVLSKIEEIFNEKKNEEIWNKIKKFEQDYSKYVDSKIITEKGQRTRDSIATILGELSNLKLLPQSNSNLDNKILSEITNVLNLLSNSDLDIRFNPDCCCKVVKHVPEENLELQRTLITSAADFIITHQIPLFIQDCLNQTILLIDGRALIESMHSYGINIRYLGKLINSIENITQLSYVLTILKTELLCRCARHIFQNYIQKVNTLCTGTAVAHFLNCLFGTGQNNQIVSNSSMLNQFENFFDMGNVKKSSKKKRKPLSTAVSQINSVLPDEKDSTIKENSQKIKSTIKNSKDGLEWRNLCQKNLWKLLSDDALSHYGYNLDCSNCDQYLSWSKAQRLAVLRRFCLINGVQLISKNYFLENGLKKLTAPFVESDVYNLIPVVKHINPRSQDAQNFYLSALNLLHQGFPRLGYELMLEAHNMMNNIYGPLHSDLALCLRFLARMAYALGEFSDALTQQHKALIITERCNGFDNFEAVFDYINLAHYSFANLHLSSSLKLIYRARYLLLVLHGEEHILMSQIDVNIGIMLYSIQEYENSIKYLQNALRLYQKYDYQFCLKTALIYRVLGSIYSCINDFRSALQMEKYTFNIYTKLFGKDHEKTKQSSECLKHFTKHAVDFQRKMNDAALNGQGLAGIIPPINKYTPTLQNVIEMLNLFNNFIF